MPPSGPARGRHTDEQSAPAPAPARLRDDGAPDAAHRPPDARGQQEEDGAAREVAHADAQTVQERRRERDQGQHRARRDPLADAQGGRGRRLPGELQRRRDGRRDRDDQAARQRLLVPGAAEERQKPHRREDDEDDDRGDAPGTGQ